MRLKANDVIYLLQFVLPLPLDRFDFWLPLYALRMIFLNSTYSDVVATISGNCYSKNMECADRSGQAFDHLIANYFQGPWFS